jgi:formylglycine-generating enzyme required for sulfatase activity
MKDKETKDKGRDVFISYASDKGDSIGSKDRDAADRVYDALEAKGIRCWAAHRDILPGDDWLDSIIAAVEKSQVLVLVFSANANNSKWVKDEITMALDEDIKIIPFRIDDVSPRGGLKILKYRCQWLDAFTSPIEVHIGKLVNVVCRHLGKEPKISKKSKVNEQPEAPGKEIPIPKEMPEEIKFLESKAQKIYKNDKGFWEADHGDGIIMVYIPAGKFKMGQTGEEKQWLIDQIGIQKYNEYYKNELPLHDVHLDGCWMGKYEVTLGQYKAFISDQGYAALPPYVSKYSPGDDHPVIGVSWEDANAYCKWLSKKKGLNFKLPTEAQWEKASRGADGRKYPWGNDEPDETLANFMRKVGKTSPVGSFPQCASPYGLLDMAGNVWEWCRDIYGDYYYNNSPKENPTGPKSGSLRVLRGGSWSGDASYLRCANRSYGMSSAHDGVLGFRLCQEN